MDYNRDAPTSIGRNQYPFRQPEIHKAGDGALEVTGGHGHLLCAPKSPQKASNPLLQVPREGVNLLCEFLVAADWQC